MRNIIIAILILLSGCKQSTKNPLTEDIKRERYIRLLTRFKDISFDTLEVFSLADGIKIEKYKYKGVQLDSAEVILFPQKIAEAHFVDPPGLFACYKFKIDSSRVGLIARTPSEYYPSSIKLFIYTTNKDTLIEVTEIAQYIGDAGALMDVNSWLFKDTDKNIKAFKWIRESFDNSVENEKDTTISEWSHFSLYNLSNNTYDTLSNDIAKLPLPFTSLVTRKNNPMSKSK